MFTQGEKAEGMKPYIGLVHQDPGSAYGITFPDAPGYISAADSLDDLFAMAEEALGLWIEDRLEQRADLEPLRDLSEIRRDPEWAEAFVEAVLVIAVPARPLRIQDAA